MVVVTHEMKFAHDVADYVVFMDDGAIVEQGKPEQLFDSTTNERTRAFWRGITIYKSTNILIGRIAIVEGYFSRIQIWHLRKRWLL